MGVLYYNHRQKPQTNKPTNQQTNKPQTTYHERQVNNMIEYIIVISDCKYGKTYEVKYSNTYSSFVYSEHTVPADVKDLVDMSQPTLADERTTFTIKKYYF